LAAECGHRFPHRRINRLLDETNRTIRESDVGTVGVIAAKLPFLADVSRSTRDEAARGWWACGDPGAASLASLSQHQDRVGAFQVLLLDSTIVPEEPGSVVLQGKIDRIRANPSDTQIMRWEG